MTNYIEQGLDISSGQKEKIKLAISNKEAVTIRVANAGDDLIALTETQIKKINTAFVNDKSVNIKLGKAQLKYNKDKVKGGFLGALLGIAATVAKSIVTEALTGVASSAVNKILGNGLYMKKGDRIVKVKEYGSGLVLSPKATSEFKRYGDGVYVKKDNGIYEGEGIIGDLVKHIPILNILF